MSDTLTTTARNVDLATLHEILLAQRSARHDVVATPGAVRSVDGQIHLVGGGEPEITLDGVTSADLVLEATEDFDAQAAKMLSVPVEYYRRTRARHVGLLDQTFNTWMDDRTKPVMIRSFRDGNGGVARSIHSDQFGAWDHLDFLTGTLEAIEATGEPVRVRGLNLSERSLRLDFVAPNVTALAPQLLAGYTSPFTGQRGEDLPVVASGVRFSNSETGWGKLSIVPFVEVLICTNGMTMRRFAEDMTFERTHRGTRQGIGAVDWSAATIKARIEALVAESADVLRHFFNPQWFAERVAEIEQAASTPLPDGADVPKIIETVSAKLAFTDAERDGILQRFIQGGQFTNGGVVQAITAHAQDLAHPDRAAHLEDRALDALTLV